MGVEVVRDLKKSAGVAQQETVSFGRLKKGLHFHFLWIPRVELLGLHQSKHGQPVARQHSNVPIVIEESTRVVARAMKKVFAEKERLIRTPDQTKNRWRNVGGATENPQTSGLFHYCGSRDEKRDFIGMDRNALLPINPGSVVRHNYEYRIRPQILSFRGLEKLSQGKIGIFHRMLPPSLGRVFGDSSFGIRVGFVIGHGKSRRKEGLL